MEKIKALIQDKKGANLVEYIILVGVIALICIAAFRTFGTAITGKVGVQSAAVTAI
jgi:pilus assembly protein Flp/PilA